MRQLHDAVPDLLLHVGDGALGLEGRTATTERQWDSCFDVNFAKVAAATSGPGRATAIGSG